MPAAMVLPMAAAMPNHIPRTCNRRPELRGGALLCALRLLSAPEAVPAPMLVGGGSDVLDNGRTQGNLRAGHHDRSTMIVAP